MLEQRMVGKCKEISIDNNLLLDSNRRYYLKCVYLILKYCSTKQWFL